ncbi:hypothetical protein [Nonomuraea sp. NPDC003201]
MLYATTTDFREFSEPKIWHDPGHAVIDSAVIKHNGVYYRYTKDERDQTPSVSSAKLITAEKSRELTSTTYDFVADCPLEPSTARCSPSPARSATGC